METQRNTRCLGRWSPLLLLLGLVIPPATTQALSYKEAVLRAVDGLNQRSSDENLYHLLELDQPPKRDKDSDTAKPVSFMVKETVCPRIMKQTPEQCDFKENGLVKQRVGTVILDPVKDYFDASCDEPQRVKRFHSLGSLIQRHQQTIRDKSKATRHGIRIITRPKLLLAS
uniref:Uncharacterized protein n=1 Tax=Equus asinus asinus TaxID=83772 RepID=A0A8C4PKY0_EQUAS